MERFNLKGKVAVITGGAGVLCSCMAQGFADAGVKIALLDLAQNKAQVVADGITAQGGEAIAVGTNVLDLESLREASQTVMDRFGSVDILINGAGGNKVEATTSPNLSFFDLPPDALQWVINLNLLGTIYPTQIFGRLMADQGSGSILNISSMAAFTPLTNTVAYSAAKAAISNFTQWMSVHFCQEYATTIRVNAIAPGFLLTQQNRYLLEDEEGNRTERGQKIIDRTPMARYGKPEELIGAAIFLCSDAASFITGVVLPIDGGFNAYSGV
ncbi:MAG: SDR family oxidoreductase [Chloroflexota bacterium]|jgi:NAD(P)-dependent dehydrogenase (short-subunit alcohol dehydrogenase family)|nr:SDR family oxidoreductase [Chloroflexota bacterium]